MNVPNPNIENSCLRTELAAYIDGELAPREELELEAHLAVCRLCAFELNEQKRLLSALDFALEDEKHFKLPENFTKVVVANAESKVNGLRCPQERLRAFLVSAALILFVVIGIGGDAKTVAKTFLKIGEQILAVGGFALFLIYDVAYGLAIILRSLNSQFVFNSAFSVILFVGLFFICVFALSRVLNLHRHS